MLEPTNAQVVEFGHRGSAFVQVQARGRGGHASRSTKGLSSTQLLTDFLHDIPALEQKWINAYSHQTLGRPVINITQLKAGNSSPNVIHETAYATLDIRTTPELSDHLERALKQLEALYTAITLSIINHTSYGLCDTTSKWYRVAQATLGLPFEVARGSTDQVFFTQAGIPALIFGPGTKDCIHAPNEYVEVNNLKVASKAINQLISGFSQM